MKNLRYFITLIAIGTGILGLSQQPFKPGNLVVYRVGDGTAVVDGNASKVFLDEYTASGTLVQSILMPVSGQKLTMNGDDPSMGLITLSADGKYLLVPGWNADIGTGVTYGEDRSIAVVDFNGAVSSMTVIPNPNFLPPGTVTSNNGTNLWISGGGGPVDYATASSSSSINIGGTSVKSINIAAGQLYVGRNANSIYTVGTGLPMTTGQTTVILPGIGNVNPFQFAFADLDPGTAGVDVLYIACQASVGNGGGGIRKYSLVSGSWVLNGIIGTQAERYAGLTIKVLGSNVTIFATRAGTNNAGASGINGGDLVSLVDNSGYNGTLVGTPTLLARVSTRFGTPNFAAFRGVALVPQPMPYAAGNLVVCRVGDGTAVVDGHTSKVFLDEYTASGTLVQSILMPVSGQKLTMNGDDPSLGLMTLSADGKYLLVPGWNADIGTGVTYGEDRSIAVVDFNGAVKSITLVSNPDFWAAGSAVSDNGTNLWFSGGGSPLDYATAGSSISISIDPNASLNSLAIANGQLYAGQPGGLSINKIGTGLPTTSGQTFTALPGISSVNPFQFAFADLDLGIPGVDVLYIACQASAGAGGGGIRKYSLVNGSWVLNGIIGTQADRYAGLTIKVSGTNVTVFATRAGTNTSGGINGGDLVALTDNSGYNGTLTGIPTILARISTRFGTANFAAFRGVALVPQPCKAVSNLQAFNVTSSQATIKWAATNGETNFEYFVTTSPTPPASGTPTNNTSITVTGLTNAITYYAHVRTNCSLSPSEWTTVSFTTICQPPSAPFPNINISDTGVTTIKWNQVFGASSYEYFVSTNSATPTNGTPITDTSVVVAGLNAVTTYYLHIRSNCGSGAFSVWITKPFSTGCFMPALTVNVSRNSGHILWNKINNAVKYEYALTHSAAKPLSGSYTTDTFYVSSEQHDGALKYFHLRSICTDGRLSEWTTVDFTIQGIQIFPNPFNESITINLFKINNSAGKITITDALGRIIKQMQMTANSRAVDTRTWAPGIYFVRYENGQNRYTVTILK